MIITNRYTEDNYLNIFNEINQVIKINDKIINIDFEKALSNAAYKFSKNIRYCFFHYTKNVNKYART